MIAQMDDGEGGRFKRHWTRDGERTLCERDIANEDYPALRVWHVTDGMTEQQFYEDTTGGNCRNCQRAIGYKLHPIDVQTTPIKKVVYEPPPQRPRLDYNDLMNRKKGDG